VKSRSKTQSVKGVNSLLLNSQKQDLCVPSVTGVSPFQMFQPFNRFAPFKLLRKEADKFLCFLTYLLMGDPCLPIDRCLAVLNLRTCVQFFCSPCALSSLFVGRVKGASVSSM
jgi:hypothetical protein